MPTYATDVIKYAFPDGNVALSPEQLLLARRRGIDILFHRIRGKYPKATAREAKRYRRQIRRLVGAANRDANRPRESNAVIGQRENVRRRKERDAVIRERRAKRAKEHGEVAKFERGELKPVFE